MACMVSVVERIVCMLIWSEHLVRHAGVKGGRPCLRGTGVPVETIAERFAAGEGVTTIAADYCFDDAARRLADLELAVVAAIRFVLVVKGTNLNAGHMRDKINRLLPLEPTR